MRRGGRRPFGIFPKIHPIWWPDPSLTFLLSIRNVGVFDFLLGLPVYSRLILVLITMSKRPSHLEKA